MLESYARARAAVWRPANAVVDLGIDLRRKPAAAAYVAVPHVCISDSEYSAWLSRLTQKAGAPRALSPERRVLGISARTIFNVVSRHYGVTVDQLLGTSHATRHVVPRHVAMYLVVHGLGFSFSRAGMVFQGRDHTTILAAYHKMVKRIQINQALAEEIAGLERACGLS
jgi:chromosomal replication initiation ATPase DnaA